MQETRLKDYPHSIHAATIELAEIDRAISNLKFNLAERESDADQLVSLDSSLKNDLQRSVAKDRFLGEAYAELSKNLIELKFDRSTSAAFLSRLEDEFKVAVLEMRLKIAQLSPNE